MIRPSAPRVLPVLILLLFSGCAGIPENDRKAPVSTPSTDNKKQAAIIKDSPAPEESLMISASASLDQKDYAKSIVFLERAIRLSPREADLWIRLSDSHLKEGNFNISEQYARKAIALSRGNSATHRLAWLQLAKVFEKTGKPKEASKLRRKYQFVTG